MKLRFVLPLIGLLYSGVLPAQEKLSKEALVKKAIEAAGAEEYKKLPGLKETAEGKINLQGQEISFKGDVVRLDPDKSKTTLALDFGGQKLKMVRIMNGAKVRTLINDMETPEPEGGGREAKESLHVTRLESLLPLRDDKALEIKLLDEKAKVEDAEAFVLEVKAKDLPDVKMYFDAKSNLLVKLDRKTRGEDGGDVKSENYFLDYKKVDGIMHAMREKSVRDGKPYMDVKLSNVKRLEKVDAKEFDVSD